MSKISKEVIAEWASKKKYIQDRLNRIKKRLKKYSKQERHFELRLRLVKEYESKRKNGEGEAGVSTAQGEAPSTSKEPN